MTHSFVTRREWGLPLRIGDRNKIYKSLYSSIKEHKFWNLKDPTSDKYGSVFNLEFCPDG